MWKAAFAAAIAFAGMGSSLALCEDRTGSIPARIEGTDQSVVDQRIAQIKGALRLTPEQERYWPPVEAAIRAVLRKSEAYETASASGLLQRVGARAGAVAREAVALRRVAAASQPLLRVLDPGQRRDAIRLAHALGLGRYVAAF